MLCLCCCAINCQTYSINSCYTAGKPSINVTLHSNNGTYSITNDDPPWMLEPTDSVFQARKCDCVDYEEGQSYYCPVGFDNCFTRRRWQDVPPYNPPFCTNEQTNLVSFAISVSPGLYGLFTIILIVLCCSKRGEMAISCCCNSICRGYTNRVYASYLLQRDPELARAMVRQWCLRRWATAEAHRRAGVETDHTMEYLDPNLFTPRPLLLRLRTRAYAPPAQPSLTADNNEDAEGDQEDPCCMICFAPLVLNEKIGDLECKHEFHSNCLKTWLKKNNSCPLCLRRDVAETIFTENVAH